MHQIAPNYASSFKISPGVTPPEPHTGEGDTSSPDPSPTWRFAPLIRPRLKIKSGISPARTGMTKYCVDRIITASTVLKRPN